MYDKSAAFTGYTIEETTRYDQFREDKIRMALFQTITGLHRDGYDTFICNIHTNIGLLAADTVVMLREAAKCRDICLIVIIPDTGYPAGGNELYRALFHDLLIKADVKEILSEKESFRKALRSGHIVFCYDEMSAEMEEICASGKPTTNIRKMI